MEVLGKDKFLAGIFESCGRADLSKVTFLNEIEAAEQAQLEAAGRLKAIAEQNKPFDVTDAILDDIAHVLEIDKWDGYSRDEFKKGMLVEQEHGGTVGYDPVIMGKIVLDHLKEAKDYYTKLSAVEAAVKEAKKVDEAEADTLKVVAKGIADKAEADKIAADVKGSVAPDPDKKDHFMVTVKEQAASVREGSQNKAWGFYGTIKSNYGLGNPEADEVFSYMEDVLVSRMNIPAEKAGKLLDSRYGRHLADELSFFGAAQGGAAEIKQAIDKWVVAPKSQWVVKEADNVAAAGNESKANEKAVEKIKESKEPVKETKKDEQKAEVELAKLAKNGVDTKDVVQYINAVKKGAGTPELRKAYHSAMDRLYKVLGKDSSEVGLDSYLDGIRRWVWLLESPYLAKIWNSMDKQERRSIGRFTSSSDDVEDRDYQHLGYSDQDEIGEWLAKNRLWQKGVKEGKESKESKKADEQTGKIKYRVIIPGLNDKAPEHQTIEAGGESQAVQNVIARIASDPDIRGIKYEGVDVTPANIGLLVKTVKDKNSARVELIGANESKVKVKESNNPQIPVNAARRLEDVVTTWKMGYDIHPDVEGAKEKDPYGKNKSEIAYALLLGDFEKLDELYIDTDAMREVWIEFTRDGEDAEATQFWKQYISPYSGLVENKKVKESKVDENLQIALSHAVTSLDNASKFANAALKAEGIDKKEQLDLAMQELTSAEADIAKAIDARKLVPRQEPAVPVTVAAEESKEIAALAEKLFVIKYLKSQKSISEKAKKFIADVAAIQLSEEKRGKVMAAFTQLCAKKK